MKEIIPESQRGSCPQTARLVSSLCWACPLSSRSPLRPSPPALCPRRLTLRMASLGALALWLQLGSANERHQEKGGWGNVRGMYSLGFSLPAPTWLCPSTVPLPKTIAPFSSLLRHFLSCLSPSVHTGPHSCQPWKASPCLVSFL